MREESKEAEVRPAAREVQVSYSTINGTPTPMIATPKREEKWTETMEQR